MILGLLFWFLPEGGVVEGMLRIPPLQFMIVFLLFLVGHGVSAAKWWNLLDRGFPAGVALRAHFAGLAANLCLPGVAGGDAVRAGIAWRAAGDGAKVTAGSAADRLIDLVALATLCIAGAAALAAWGGGDSGLPVLPAALLMVFCVGAVFLFAPVAQFICRRFPRLPGHGAVLKLALSFDTLARRPLLLAGTLLVSLAVQAGFLTLAYWLAKSVGVSVPWLAWAFAWSLAKIIAVLPVSLGGLGVREASLAALLTPLGADAAQVVAAGLAWQAVLFLTGGLGALVLALTGGGLLEPAVEPGE
ncbi:MAG: flippase-like domain-containing protein [Rhodobacteraceae bacterium]|nr:flippase-like domain-containing protein [Paracoccaceae bacterium]